MTHPLRGVRVLLTRPKGQAGELAGLLRRAGASVRAVPAIRLLPPEDPARLRAAARRLAEGGYRLAVFTSANAASRFLPLFRRHGRRPAGLRVAAIGPKTAQALREGGLPASVVPAEFVAEALARRLKVRRGERVLLPRAAKAREVLPRALRRRGAVVDVVPAYRTAPDPAGRRRLRALLLGSRPPHWVSFTSPSTVEGLFSQFTRAEWRRIFRRTRAACIGPVTERALRRLGVRPAARARRYTAKGLYEAIRGRHA